MLEKCIVFPYHQRKTHRYQENFEVLMSCIMKYISKSMYIRSLSKTNKIPPSKHLFFQSSSGFCSFPLQWWTMFFHLHLHDSKVSFCGAGMSKKEWVMKMVALILNFFPLMVYWDIGTKWWQLLVPGTVSPNSYQGFKFSLTATISSLLIVRKVIPYMDDLQYSLIARNVKIWLLTGLCKLAKSFLHLTVLPIPSQGDFQWLVATNTHVASMPKSDLWWQRFRKAL